MFFDFAKLDLNDKGNLYKNLYIKIRDAVSCGAIKQGERLPSIRQASKELGISRTTVENAYTRLCIEGIVESEAQKGYYVTGNFKSPKTETAKKEIIKNTVKYDFSSRYIDTLCADTKQWKKYLRSVIRDSGELTSYGDSQGERSLREALTAYSYKSRGVRTTAENIVLGAGIGPLLNILCALIGRNLKIGFENGGFETAQNIFTDYGIETVILDCDSNGATIESIKSNDIDVLFLLPSSLSKISVAQLMKRRNEINDWAVKNNKLIIEDDYNGELRYTAKTVPSFQGKAPDRTVYIGSFSKLLLPSVRIAYMALPPFLVKEFLSKSNRFNQTCGKIEQLALKEYIENGCMEKHFRKLSRLYYNKSQKLSKEITGHLKSLESITLYESSLSIVVNTYLKKESKEICRIAEFSGVRIMPANENGSVRLCFAGIGEENIADGVKKLCEIFERLE